MIRYQLLDIFVSKNKIKMSFFHRSHLQSPGCSVEFHGKATSARYFYRAEFVFKVYDLEQGGWTEICLLCGLGAEDPGVEGLA